MSVVPLRISNVARTSSKLRDPPGTVNIPYGYRLSQPRRRSRSSVNLTHDEPSRLPGNDTSPPVKHQSNQANGVSSGDGEGGPAEVENGEKQAAKNTANNQTAKSISKHPSNGAIKSSQLRGKHSSRKKPEQRVAIFPVNPNVEKDEEDAKEARQLGTFLRTQDFVEKTDRRILGKKFRNLVDEGITEYERGIEARREKLRASLLAEEKCLTREIIDQAQRGADLRMDETLRRARELRERAEEKRLAEVREKRARQYLERCPEARNRSTRKATLETKYSNLVQIAEKKARRESERELANIWHELMLRRVEAEEARESEEARRRMAVEKSTVATLEKQIAGKLALREDERRAKEEEREKLERDRGRMALEGSSSPARRREKMTQLRRDLDEQSSAARRSLDERAREAEKIERAFRVVGEAEMARERSSRVESVTRSRREIAAYMSSLEEFKREEARHRAEFDDAVTADARQFEARRDRARQKSRQERELGMRKVLEAREQQVRDKRAYEEELTRRAEHETELRLRQAEAEASTDAEAENRKREAALRYGRELKAQVVHTAIMRRRENEEIEKIHLDNLQRERECEELAQRTLSAPEIITPSAFQTMLKECAARRDDATRKNICSSRSTTQLPAINT